MATQQDILLKFSADTGNVDSAIQDVQGGVEKTDTAVGGLTNQLDKMSGGAITGFRNFTAGIKTGVTGLKTFKVALAATGIGLLVVAVASLVSYFQSTKEGSEKLKVIMSTLGAVVDVLRDRLSKMGKILFEAISNPQETIKNLGKLIKENLMNRFEGMLELIPAVGTAISLALKGKFSEAGKVATDAAGKVFLGVESVTDAVSKAGEAVADLTEEIKKEAQAAADLEKALNKLKDEERDFIKQRAETNKQIAEARLLAEDDTLAIEERIKALQRSVDLEQQTVDEQLRLAEERARITREQVALGESTEEDLQRVAEAEAAVIDLQTASLKTQKRLQTELNSLKAEATAAQKAESEEEKKRIKDEQEAREKAYQDQLKAKQTLEDELYRESLNAREQEELALMQEFDMRVALAGDDEGLIQAATESFNQKIKAIDDKYRKQKADADKVQRDADDVAKIKGVEMASAALGALSQLNEAFTGESESDQKKAFERNKKFQVAQAIIQTGMAVTGALTAGGNPIKLATGAQFVEAAIAAATGVAQIATIKKTKFGSSSTPPPPGNSGGGATGAIPQSPQLDLGFLGGGAGQTGIRTYVVSSEVSNSQQANQRINDQASLVG
jgi:hypothetical protein